MFGGRFVGRTDAREIERASERLSKDQMSELRGWFEEFDARQWDRQFEEVGRTGKLDAVADQALRDLEFNRCKEL